MPRSVRLAYTPSLSFVIILIADHFRCQVQKHTKEKRQVKSEENIFGYESLFPGYCSVVNDSRTQSDSLDMRD